MTEDGIAASEAVAQSIDRLWDDVLGGGLYSAIANLGIFFAVGTLLFFMVQWLKDVIDYNYSRPVSSLIWPFIVVILLNNSGQGSVLSSLTLGVRNAIDTVNQQVVLAADANQTYQQALNMAVGEEIAGSLLRSCQSLTGEQQNQCFLKAKEKIEPLWREYRFLYGNQAWIYRLENKVNQTAFGTRILSENSFNALLGSTTQTMTKNFLISSQYAFQNLLEATMLLIATLGPLAVGGSLLPVAAKPIFAWMTGFLALGIAKISFNIMAVSASTAIINGPAQDLNADPDLLWFTIFLGILAPILSLLLSSAGGFAILNSISNAAPWTR
ncbi:MAG: hypothetical protein AAFQ41_02400 [Cyanobacteria bacterium J06623_7]